MYECLEVEKEGKVIFEKDSKEKLSTKMGQQHQQMDLLSKNIELKRKAKTHLLTELESLKNECEEHKEVNEDEIDRLTN